MWRTGRVIRERFAGESAGEYEVEITGVPTQARDVIGRGEVIRAHATFSLCGIPRPGDEVALTVNALARGLGTGGHAMIAANLTRLPDDPPAGPGHVMKARYTPVQTMVLGVDEQDSPHHHRLASADDLGGMPVIGADLHSALPAIIAGIRSRISSARIAYIMSDGGALPASYSRTAAALRQAGEICGTISCGQAFDGDLDAVNIHSGLLAAKEVWDADIAIVCQGPGNLGTGTRWGFSGVQIGEALNAGATLGGIPIACLRMSVGDKRTRHQGISHHTLTTLTRIVSAPTVVALPHLDKDQWRQSGFSPETLPEAIRVRVGEQVQVISSAKAGHEIRQIPLREVRERLEALPVRLSTMGRTLADDPLPFVAAWAAGVAGAQEIASWH